MKIAQISDLHVVAEGKTLGVAPMAENLEKVVAHINGLGPDMVLVSGDIADTGALAEVQRAASILAKLEAPFYVVPGNHDTREALQQGMPAAVLPAREAGHLSYAVELPDMRILALDSSDPDAPNGRICEARAGWLAKELAVSAKPALIVMHHPPLKFAVDETDRPPLEGARLLADIVAQHSQIERILCGHIHLFAQALWQGCLVCTAPSIGMRLNWSPHSLAASSFLVSQPAYLWHMLNEDGELITHMFSLDDPEGPFAFT
ncbi:MAG: phosphodiesterase [Rhodobacteraceae bacterium]|nr:phosphodiesterase [Paracoccaceae bacterium]